MDYTVEDTIHLAFTTRAFATGVPTVLAGTPVVSAYEAASAVQITAGITLGVDHDSVVGLNLLTIVATGANGYEAGKDYNLVITTGTVGGVSVVGEVVGTFSLGRSAAAVDLANATDGLGAIKTVVDAARDCGRTVAMCGEMAGNPLCTVLLLGMGLEELSMSSVYIPVVRKIIRAIDEKDAVRVAHNALRLEIGRAHV